MDSFVKCDPDEKRAIDEETEDPVDYQTACLFCSDLRSKRFSEHGLPTLQGCQGNEFVNHQLWSVFILRKLAQYPAEEMTRLFKDTAGLSLSDWFLLCESCGRMVKEAMSIFHKILMLEVKIKSFQDEVKQKIEQSSKVQKHVNIVTELRKRFEQVTLSMESQDNEYSDSDHDALDLDDQDGDGLSNESPQPINKSTEEITSMPHRLYANSPCCYERDQKAHTFTQHTCPKCNFSCSTASALETHISKPCKPAKRNNLSGKSPGKSGLSLACKICLGQQIYTNKSSYLTHMKQHRKCKYSCPKCRYPFTTAIQMERHISKKICGKVLLKSNPSPKQQKKLSRKSGRQQLTLKKDFICHLCPFKTTLKVILDNHVKGHELYDCQEIDGKFKCKYCQKDFPSSLTLKRHIREDHHEDHGAPVLKCPTCSKIFCKTSTLKFHIAEVHEQQCKFFCELCGYRTMRKFVLDKHMEIHRSERSFVCDLCAASFKTNTNFNTHMRRVHGSSRRTVKHTCKYCKDNNTYDNKSLLDRHLKDKHKDLYVHSCDECENSYLSGASLQLHKKINHGGEQAECQFCGCKVLNRVYLYSHYKICQKKPPNFKYKYPRS